ncbi:NAD(P)H-dependent oxidoreductase [Pseudonocardia zijingensis]|jgi:chromate reductase|uniref:NAD(P)H-dependent oxidoreductase n=1 Tax=Pseudonocardia zijingensis TaxID=153376 RepID=A0ABP3Z0T1_9PSEU
MLLLGVSGSLRRGSHNRRLLEAAAGALPSSVRLQVFDGLAEIPPYVDDEGATAPVQRLRSAIAGADGLLFATPEYNGSVPGQLKNALDWASRPYPDNALRGRPALVVGASTGLFGAVWAQAELRKVLRTAGADVLDDELPVGSAETAFAEGGGLADPEQAAVLARAVDRLVRQASRPLGLTG